MLRGDDTVQAGGWGDGKTMTENGGGGATAAFVAALRAASTALAEVPGKLEGTRVHETAFGKLFEAAEVRDAYHQRLPEIEKDIAEAREVIGHFVAGLEGGHPIGPRRPAGAVVPADPDGATATATPSSTPTVGPAVPAIPEQASGEGEATP